MKNKVVITDEVRLAVAREQLEKTNRNLKIVAGTTTVMAAIKGGVVVGAKVLTFAKGTTMFLGCLPIPNYFSLLAGGLFAVETYIQVKACKDRIQEEKAKNKTFDTDELFYLEDEDD